MNKYALIIIVAVLGLYTMGTYNGLVNKQLETEQTWSQVENVYQRRFDLIPNLVETVKGVANFEKSTFTDIAEARAKVNQINVDMKNAPATVEQMKAFQEAQQGLGAAMSRLMAVSENYPELKANQNFLQLQAQLEGTENRIAVERRNFNMAVQAYNGKVKRFPGNILANVFGFETRSMFEADAGAKTAPKVQF